MPKISHAELLEALEALRWRSLLESQLGSYTQKPVVIEYVTQQLVDRMCHEIFSGSILDAAGSIHTHALLKISSRNHAQEKILQLIPVLPRL